MAPHGREMSKNLRKEIITLHKKGEGYKKFSKALHISQNTVAKVIQKCKKDGSATILQRRPGRPQKLTSRQEPLLMRRVKENRHASSLQLAKAVESQTGVTVSHDTIRHTLQRNGMHGYCPRRKPLLKPMHKKARLEFARAHAEKDEDYCDSILWSDETKITVFGTNGFKTVWRRKGEDFKEKCMVPTVKHGGGSVLMWDCMSAAGIGELHFIDGIMNSTMYCSILKEKMLPSLRALGRHALFQHGNDPKHTSKATVAFLKKNRVKVIEWPSMSPDLNPIEHLWGILKRQVEHHSPSSIQALKEVILEEWKKIDVAICRQLVHSMPRTLGAVLKNHGGHTKY
ncbi:TCB1 transposase, partial [Polypterus senegalus]